MDRTITDSGNIEGDRGPSYNRFVTSLKSNNNTWYSPDAQPFTWNYPNEYEPLDFAGFASRTGQDQNSSFRDPGPIACDMPSAQQPAPAKPGVYLPLITGATLINAATDQPIGELKSGATIDLRQIGTNQLSVVAITDSDNVGSVTFALDGQVVKTENYAPYAIKGNNGPDYMPWTPDAGERTLVVTPYSEAKGQGQAGQAVTIRLTVVN
jgi:hypothetical protein